jgi:hypothetical protein
LAVFVAEAKSAKKDKKMGWRANTVKVCLTHLKDEQGVLLLTPPLLQQPAALATLTGRPSVRLAEEVAPPAGNGQVTGEVTWADLAAAHQSGNIDALALLARALKAQAEDLKSKVISSQTKLIENLTRK